MSDDDFNKIKFTEVNKVSSTKLENEKKIIPCSVRDLDKRSFYSKGSTLNLTGQPNKMHNIKVFHP